MLRHELPPGYQRSAAPQRSTLDAYVGIVDDLLRTDKALTNKQRHTAKRTFKRLREEYGYWQPDHGDQLCAGVEAAHQRGVCASGASLEPCAGRFW